MLLSEVIFLSALSKVFWIATSFLHQDFCTPLIPGAVQFFILLISFVSFSVSMSNSFITDLLTKQSLHFSSLGVLFSFSHIPPQNLKNFSISGILPSLVLSPSNVLKKSFWSRWNLMLSCFLFLFHFSSLTFLYLSLSIYCSFAVLKLLEVISLPICTFNYVKITFSFFVAFLLTFPLKSSLLVLAIHWRSCFISFFDFRFLLFPPLAPYFAVPFNQLVSFLM